MRNKKKLRMKKSIIGMVHLSALPGTPLNSKNLHKIIDLAVAEANIYARHDLDAIMIENMHDVPYQNSKVGSEIVAAMAVIGREIKNSCKIPLGIQVLAGANKEALAVALACGAEFIRAEGFVFGHVADEGYINSCAANLLRYRKSIEAEHIKIYTDIKKKHSSHSITADVSISETAKAAEFFLSDGVIVTGTSTGESAAIEEVKSVYNAVNIPVLIGSGITVENIETYLAWADMFIVGSHFKDLGNWANTVDEHRVIEFMEHFRKITEI